jgi:exonuclease SbcD
MVKLLATGDLHYRGTSPRARTDDFPAALERKLLEVFDLALRNGCLGIIIPGDIVDTPGIALPTLVELCLLLARSPCPIYTVPGNHDLWGGSPDTVDRTPYGALTRFGLIRDLSRGLYPVDGVLLTGHGYDADTDRDLAQYMPHTPLEPSSQQSCRYQSSSQQPLAQEPFLQQRSFRRRSSQQRSTQQPPSLQQPSGQLIRVHVAHGMLLERAPGHALSRYTLASDVAAQNEAPDVLVVGHEHAGFGVLRIGRTTFVNPGALCRLSASTVEMARQIRVCLLTLSAQAVEGPGRGIETELLPIESAQPGLEVLSRAHLHETGSSFSRADAFVALLEAEIVEDPLEIDKVIDEVAAAHGLPKEVVDEAIRRVAEASESLGYASSVW